MIVVVDMEDGERVILAAFNKLDFYKVLVVAPAVEQCQTHRVKVVVGLEIPFALFRETDIIAHRCENRRLDIREESEGGLYLLSRCLELEAFVDVLGDSRSVTGFEQVHVAHRAFGRLASASDVVLGGHALEVDVPAVELALSHDELGSCCRSSLDGGSCGLSDFLFCGFFSFLCHDFEVFGVNDVSRGS